MKTFSRSFVSEHWNLSGCVTKCTLNVLNEHIQRTYWALLIMPCVRQCAANTASAIFQDPGSVLSLALSYSALYSFNGIIVRYNEISSVQPVQTVHRCYYQKAAKHIFSPLQKFLRQNCFECIAFGFVVTHAKFASGNYNFVHIQLEWTDRTRILKKSPKTFQPHAMHCRASLDRALIWISKARSFHQRPLHANTQWVFLPHFQLSSFPQQLVMLLLFIKICSF